MFYESQTEEQQNNYKAMLEIIGNLTLLFSDSDCPYLPYRCHENIFCKYFEAVNLGRLDCSADAQKNRIGIGLKTWMGSDDQKVAEFGKLRPAYEGLEGIELVRKIAEYRNARIRVTKNSHGIDEMIYHIVKRVPGKMKILEHAFDYIDIDNIQIIENKGNSNNTYFTDGRHTYHFSISKNTLYMIFSDLNELDSFDVQIMADPYLYLNKLREEAQIQVTENIETISSDRTAKVDYTFNHTMLSDTYREHRQQICLRLYSVSKDGVKFVGEKSGLNQWNADGRSRDENEIYIPYLTKDRNRDKSFFPPRDTPFDLYLPDGTKLSAKVCQAAYAKMPDEEYEKLSDDEKRVEDQRRSEGKAIMSNPNKELGKWLLRKVFELAPGTVVTYEMLEKFGVDSVIFTKISNSEYSIDFSEIGTYEEFYEEAEEESESDLLEV
ncbi:hypothetical protein SAMN02910292_01224 [Lachnospiraceae bacterium XBB2008]|nr:hypothetical protein SAMN02910292_01224 [Lachnospiraceae bacterium XBB2008]